MKDIARSFLSHEHIAPWTHDESAVALVDYVYDGGVWDAGFRSSIQDIHEKSIANLEMPEILTYLTYIVCMDRTQEGCIDAHIANGTVQALLTRYLAIAEEGCL